MRVTDLSSISLKAKSHLIKLTFLYVWYFVHFLQQASVDPQEAQCGKEILGLCVHYYCQGSL